jgi:prophage antirepressor-like protein
MGTNIQIFNNPKFGEVRVSERNGEPVFSASDVCNILGYTNTSKAINDHVDDEDR